ncbi:hypothetical protein [Chitinophaga sp. S165]|uniref:hypothetical protein n=1 Tax=Chitinophaga sp. S165 TaxID=2135462 RepID=UPI000D7170BF|nr:hypothetical protein [Chitinophaga sp. S165]PWV55563.1 hypothetical protein C7475_10169 [Chitinophaga sp. S165]
MQKLLAILMYAVIVSSCTDEGLSIDKWRPPVDLKPIPPTAPVRPFLFLPNTITSFQNIRCIYSFDDVVSALGSTHVPVSSFVLADGSIVPVAPPLVRAEYSVYSADEPGSLFHSLLTIERQEGSGVRTYTADVWSLGCSKPIGDNEELTNIMAGKVLVKLNTRFFFHFPPYTPDGILIKYLVL